MIRNRQARGPGARQIYEVLRAQILAGTYGNDGALPSSRALASELGVARATVTSAYEQLSAEGFVRSRQGARPRVAAVLDRNPPISPMVTGPAPLLLSRYGERLALRPVPLPSAARPALDFRYGDLAASDFPTPIWRRAVLGALAQRQDRLSYGHPAGSPRLRRALQGYLWRARTLRCEAEQIIIVNGSQQGLDLCTRLLLDPGEGAVVEDPCYPMARDIFAAAGGTITPVAADQDGLDTSRLTDVEARLAYVTPSHQFPLGSVLSIARRHRLLAWAEARDAFLIEDDYDSEYRYDINPVPPLYGLGHGQNVLYLGTVSKTLSPTLRIGYLVVPANLAAIFTRAKQIIDRHSPALEQEALATLLESGAYERHIRRIRRRMAERRNALLEGLRYHFGDRLAVEGAKAGLHIIAWFRHIPADREEELIRKAGQVALGLHPLSLLYAAGSAMRPDRAGLVMGYGGLDVRQIRRGVELLANCAAEIESGS
ncbi:PLP-dependent aminotransferase family protein [Labrys sp. KNU-23]|uniref:MocR-like pyridoxine biosynthesis transcription factor PdxR n=1 Tax=Labrys sp. KNU-23 TaxID=2789216 RepID=UPI0011F027A4|nr:PLP-dependent aminotransferase family protein [Labrys sp. KNU-23]QEN91009.1 PLP-dependent aminotransferase family protein [Labrys sp. KNU-23]